MPDTKRKLKNRFEIRRKLGQGTYGKVQLGINKETGQEVAIKTIKKSKIETEADLVRIRREIQIMSSVQHPNIIHIYEGTSYQSLKLQEAMESFAFPWLSFLFLLFPDPIILWEIAYSRAVLSGCKKALFSKATQTQNLHYRNSQCQVAWSNAISQKMCFLEKIALLWKR